jgi:O-antigen ligase
MARILSLLKIVVAHPVARVGLAFALLIASVGGLSLVAYADQYVNGGVTWSGQDTAQIPMAQVNPMGVNLFLEKEPDRNNIIKSLQMTRDGGFKWIRQDFAWNDIEISGKGIYTDTRNPGAPVNAWDKYDFIVDQANRYGLQIMARLDSPPVWARMPGDDVQQFTKGPPRDNNDFGDFAAAVAQRYKGKIKYFQIWNEPNLFGEWGGHPVSAEEYTALLKVAYERIKAVNPDAVIVTAALAPTVEDTVRNQNDIVFLENMYKAGAAPYFDVFSTMLYGLGQPPDDRRTDFKRLSFSRPVLLRQVMERYHDDKKPIWISEYAWISFPDNLQAKLNLSPQDWADFQAKNIWGKSVDEQTQGQYLVEGYERARTEWPWMGTMFVWDLRNPDGSPLEPATYFSILNADFSPRPAYNILKDYSARVPETPMPRSKPLLDLIAFPLLYIIFGLFSLASAGYTVASLGRWASAALDIPKGKFSDEVRETARNAAAVAGMALLFGLYYRAEALPLIAAALAGWWLIALLKPSTGLAMVAFAIPFFWLPKQYGSQRFPVAETMLVLVLAAVLARKLLAAFLPGVAARLHFGTTDDSSLSAHRPTTDDGRQFQTSLTDGNKDTIGSYVTSPPITASAEAAEEKLGPVTTKPLAARDHAKEQEKQAGRFAQVAVARTAEAVQPATDDLPPASASDRPSISPLDVPDQSGQYDLTSNGRRSSVDERNANYRQSLWSRFLSWNSEDAFAAPAVAMLLLGTLSLLVLANPEFAPDSARAYRWVIIEPVLFYFLIVDVIKGRRGLLRLLDFFMLAAVLVALYGLWQFVQSSGTLVVEGVSRVDSVYEQPNNLALYLGRAAPLAACLALFLPWGWRKGLYGLATLPLAATLFLTFSRGGWIGATVAMVVAVSVGLRWQWGWISSKVPRAFRIWLVGVGATVLLLGLVGLVLFPKLPERILDPGSSLLRFTIWGSALHMGIDHPVFGIGPDQFLNQFQAGYGPCQQTDQGVQSTEQGFNECFTSHPHNIFLDYWLTLGIMGVIVLVWLLWRYYRESINLARWAASRVGADPLARALALGLIAAMTDFFVHGLVDNSYFLMDLSLIFWMSCAMVQLLRRRFGIGG